MNRLIKFLLPLLLVCCIMIAAASPSFASGNGAAGSVSPAESVTPVKEEVIYANLHNDGSPKKVYVVNIFDSKDPCTVTDYGDYESVMNLTDTSEITLENGLVSFTSPSGRFYYQGNLSSAELPWDIGISYFLDGARLSADEIAGKSGRFIMKITIGDGDFAEKAFYDNYMLQISVTLDTSKCTDIYADGATVANSGGDKLITFTVMPGSESELTLEASVRDFSMDGIQISAIPFSFQIDSPDTSGVTAEFSLLTDALSQLNDGTASLLDGIGELRDGFGKFKDGLGELSDGSNVYMDGITKLADEGGKIVEGSDAILRALRMLKDSLESADYSGLDELSALPDVFYRFGLGVNSAASGLNELSANYSQGYAVLAAAINALPSDMIDISAVSMSADPDVQALLVAYLSQYQSIMTLKGTFSNLEPLFSAVGPSLLEASSGLSEVSSALFSLSAELGSSMDEINIEESLRELREGVSILIASYETFNDGLAAYIDGVGELKSGYGTLNNGIGGVADAADGISEGMDGLYDGADKLSDGIRELHDETDNLDGLISEKIEEIISGYDKSDFVPPSFVSERNSGISSVQFVFRTEGIKAPEEEAPAPAVEDKPTIWDRLLNLFGL